MMRAVGSTSGAGRTVTVLFELDSQGDEAAKSFTANWDPAVLRYEYPTLGEDAAVGTNMGLNTSQTAEEGSAFCSTHRPLNQPASGGC